MRVGRRAGAAGVLHPDIEVGTSPCFWSNSRAIWVGDPKCGSEPRHLHLTLFLSSPHTSSLTEIQEQVL